MEEIKQLKLDSQLCFPLYAASRLVTKLYQPLLKDLNLTYPQYLILLVLWENDNQLVTEIGNKLLLDTNTLTPLLKRLENKSILKRLKSSSDERKVVISLTKEGYLLKDVAKDIPLKLFETVKNDFSIEKAEELRDSLNYLINLLTKV